MFIRKDSTCIRGDLLGVLEMHHGASGFPPWSIGLSSVERWPLLHKAFPSPLCIGKFPCGDDNLLVVRLRIIILVFYEFGRKVTTVSSQ